MSKWISVEDELPEDKKDYLLFCEDTREQMVGFHHHDGKFQFAYSPSSGPIICSPTHWMPLPRPPEGSDE